MAAALFCLRLAAAVSPEWEAPVEIPPVIDGEELKGNVGNSMAVTPDGRVWLFHLESATNRPAQRTYLRVSADPASGNWETVTFPPDLPGVLSTGGGASLTVGPDGKLHAAWLAVGQNKLAYAVLDPDTLEWSDYQEVYGGPAAPPIEYFELEVDRGGTAHMIWHEGDPETSGASADVRYARRGPGDAGFTVRPEPLNLPDTLNSAFPVVHWGGCPGDLLVVAWREETADGDWDVWLNVSRDNGLTWRDTPVPVAQTAADDWDPLVLIDRHNVTHLIYPQVTGIRATMFYLRYPPEAWDDPAEVPQPERVQLSPGGEDHQLPNATYDVDRDIVYLFWKRRTLVEGSGRFDDLLGRYALLGGTWLSDIEELTDAVGTGVSAGLPDYAVDPQGRVIVNYTAGHGQGALMFMRRREVPPPLGPVIEITGKVEGAFLWRLQTEFNVTYTAETAPNLSGPWSPSGEVVGTGGPVEMELPIGPGTKFLRVKATR